MRSSSGAPSPGRGLAKGSFQQQGHRAADHWCRHARSAEAKVIRGVSGGGARLVETIADRGPVPVECAGRSRQHRHDAVSGRYDIGLGDMVDGRGTLRAVTRYHIVPDGRSALAVYGAYSDYIRIV